ncbi:MAG: hypothetical protein HGA45_15130 [Chloroflexales bacterium]|nr:hypothetical protein [Chloroflexales bacterium]
MNNWASPESERETLTPHEQLPVTYFGGVVLAVRHPDGTIYLSIRDLCLIIGLNRSSQMRRLRSHADLSQGLALFLVQTAGGPQAQEFLALEKVPAWLLGVTSRATEEVRDKLRYLQSYLVREVYAAFARLAGLPEQGSRSIEDLEELRRLDTSLAALAERQAQLEASQEKARNAWRDMAGQIRALTDRLAALEQQTEGSLTRGQRGHLYQLVQAWGSAKAEREPRLSKSAAFQTVWAALKARFRVARYEDIPAARYREAVQFVQDAYRALTGAELSLPEQGELDLL